MKALPLAAMAFLTTLGSVSAQAGVVYQTGFEPPLYSVGPLNGQDGWGNASSDVQVETTTVQSGSQAVSVNLAAFDFPNRNVVYDSSSNPGAILELGIGILLTGSLSTQVEALALAGDGGFMSQLLAEGSNFTYGGQRTPITTGVWYSLDLDINFATQTGTAFVDGVFLGEEALANPTTSLELVELGGFGSAGLNETAFYDNLSVVAAPEASTWAMLLLGFAGLGVGGYRKAKSATVFPRTA
jgi:hypothetical protein